MLSNKVVGITKRKRGASFSIAGMKEKKEEEKESEAEDLTNKPKDKFELEDLRLAWTKYATRLKAQGKQGLYTTLTKHKPNMGQGFEILFEIDAAYQQMDLDDAKAEMLGFLRSELNNYGLILKIAVKEGQKTTTHLTSKDKFLKMAEGNEALHMLREKLNLDIEY